MVGVAVSYVRCSPVGGVGAVIFFKLMLKMLFHFILYQHVDLLLVVAAIFLFLRAPLRETSKLYFLLQSFVVYEATFL